MASKERGRIPNPEYSILKSNHQFLVEQIDPIHSIDFLFGRGIFDEQDLEEIKAVRENKGKKAAAQKFMEILYSSGSHAYTNFLECLEISGYDFIKEKLEKTIVEDIPDTYAWINGISSTAPVIEKDILKISKCLGCGWEAVPLHLGSTEAQINQACMNNPNDVRMQIFTSLNKWRQRVAGKATHSVLLTAIKDSDLTSTDWTGIKEYFL